ncbi:MAG: macro domain-containing protein, partial [Clostridia bacterium]|nr:macro domain-containing protein [Clostridia bacterium]
MPFTIVRQDITRMRVDAIVNAANTDLATGGGVCGAIFRGAGEKALQAACDGLAPIRVGEAVVTPGFGLDCRYIIHAAGPVYRRWNAGQCERLLRAAYAASLRLAAERGCESIAFPLISSGIYGYPKDEALRVATAAIREFLASQDMDIYLAVFDREAFAAGTALLGSVASYIDEHYADAHRIRRPQLLPVEREALEDARYDRGDGRAM